MDLEDEILKYLDRMPGAKARLIAEALLGDSKNAKPINHSLTYKLDSLTYRDEKNGYHLNQDGKKYVEKLLRPYGRQGAVGMPTVPTPQPVPAPQQDPQATYTKFPPLKDNAPAVRPSCGASQEAIFEYCVRYIITRNVDLTPKGHNEWAGKFFSNEKNGNERSRRMSQLKHDYAAYFTSGKNTYTFEVDSIVHDFSEWFDIPNSPKLPIDPDKRMFLEIQHAIENELRESRKPNNRESYPIDDLSYHRTELGEYIYIATITTKDGTDPHFREGLQVELKIADRNYWCEVVDYDFENGLLYLTSSQRISFRTFEDKRVIVDSSFILEKLQSRIIALTQQDIDPAYPIYKFIVKQTELLWDVMDTYDIPFIHRLDLDDEQREAFEAALQKDITFIWGSPGTGKSFTLSKIIRALYSLEDERTAVCCISNVAVDQLANKVVDLLESSTESIESGNFYRAGHSTDDRILNTDFLFPNDEETERLRKEIRQKRNSLEQYVRSNRREKLATEAVILKAEIKDLRKKLQEHTDYLVKKSRVVFSTISNFILSENINQCQFDTLIVDEASMLAIPHLLALAAKVTKRIILVGDFRQLKPIALLFNRWMNTNVFEYCGISLNNVDHPALHMLKNNYRSTTEIVNIFNPIFYNNEIRPQIQGTLIDGPYPTEAIVTKIVDDGRVRFTRGGTRQNIKSAEKVIEILDEYYQSNTVNLSIGIITPYKGQVSLIRALIAEKNYPDEFYNNIKVGTIHTFQGSESNVIIYDVVDCEFQTNGQKASVGRIYHGEEGEQLLNVAVSRAQKQLIVVGDVSYFDRAPGHNLANRTLRIFRRFNGIIGI